jgi:phosphatidylglycerophosphatase A
MIRKKINILILTMGGIGFSKYAPGTVASFITYIFFICFYTYEIKILYLVGTVTLIFTYSVYAIDVSKKKFDNVDSKEIVIDEFVGQSIPILTVYSLIGKNNLVDFIFYTLAAFILFRFFDIKKPFLINKIDSGMKNGFGVMLDDVIAGIYSSIVLIFFIFFIYYE